MQISAWESVLLLLYSGYLQLSISSEPIPGVEYDLTAARTELPSKTFPYQLGQVICLFPTLLDQA